MRKKFLGMIPLGIILILAFGCNTGKYPGFKKTSSGIYYKIFTTDNTDTTKVAVGKIVTLDLKYSVHDSTLFDSKNVPNMVRFPIIASQYPGDIYEGLSLLSQGDSAVFIIQADSFFMKTVGQPSPPPFIKAGDDLVFDVKIKQVQTQNEVDAEVAAQNEQLKADELGLIQKYLTDNKITVAPDTNGIYVIEKKRGSGKTPKKDLYVTANFQVKKLTGEQLFSTFDKKEPVDFKFGSRYENQGFQSVIGKMKEGGEVEAIVPSKMGFGAQGAGEVVPPFTPLYYKIELVKVMSQAEWDKKQADKAAKKKVEDIKKDATEAVNIQKYMKENNLTAKPQPDGLVYIETLKGTGPKAENGKKVKVNYTGKLLDGTVFDSSEGKQPLEFTLGTKSVIEGWEEGIAMMNQGGKAILIVPSKLGYRDKGAGKVIPPNATLIFDVELVEVENK